MKGRPFEQHSCFTGRLGALSGGVPLYMWMFEIFLLHFCSDTSSLLVLYQLHFLILICRQLQLQQLMQVLQHQEGFARLQPAHQQQLCMQLFVRQQERVMMQQQQAAAAAAAAVENLVAAMPQQPTTVAPQNLSPRSASVEPRAPLGQPVVSMAGPNATGNVAFQRSVSQPGGEAPANWNTDTSPATSGNGSPLSPF